MIIKPNLYDGPYRVTIKADKDYNSNGTFFDIKGKIKEGVNYTFSAKVIIENLEGVEETKSVTLGLNDGINKEFVSFHTTNINDGKISLKFEGKEEITRILSYTGPYGDIKGRGMTWYEVELVEGDIGNKVFIPSKNSLEPSKQAIFLAGGYSRKFIHSRYAGGGIC